jgi:alanyl-tRNA synthetase
VNHEILANAEVATEVMDLDAARARGAMALFGEKYGERVRVVTIGPSSMELCGGTHVGSAAEVGACLLTHETSVAAGVRRIEMVTGGGALEVARASRAALRELAETLKAAPDGLARRVDGLLQELRDLKRRDDEHRRESGRGSVDALAAAAVRASGIAIVAGAVDGDDAAALRALADALRGQLGECVLLLVGRGEKGCALLAAATDGATQKGVSAADVLRRLAAKLGGKGGGQPRLAQGKAPPADPARVASALEAERTALVATLPA